MSAVVHHLELTIAVLRQEIEQLKKKNEEHEVWGKAILADFQRVCQEADEMQAFITKVMARVKEQEATDGEKTQDGNVEGV
jgi:hypothetical protein